VNASDAVVDACCLINLAAAGDLALLLNKSGFTWHLPRMVEEQGVQVRVSADPADRSRTVIDLGPVIQAGSIQRCDIEERDQELFLEIAGVHGDDPDAAALAIAEVHGWLLATDDRALANLAARRHVRTVTTATVVKRATAAAALAEHEITAMLKRIEELGRWSPHDTDPDAAWWHLHRRRG
jgi:hypothetical protein